MSDSPMLFAQVLPVTNAHDPEDVRKKGLAEYDRIVTTQASRHPNLKSCFANAGRRKMEDLLAQLNPKSAPMSWGLGAQAEIAAWECLKLDGVQNERQAIPRSTAAILSEHMKKHQLYESCILPKVEAILNEGASPMTSDAGPVRHAGGTEALSATRLTADLDKLAGQCEAEPSTKK